MKEIKLSGVNTTVRLQRYASVLPTEEEVAAFEGKLGYPLPHDYREFLLSYNGGVCELKNVIEPLSGYLCDLFGLHKDEPAPGLMRLRLPQEWEEEWGELPANLLPVGEVDSGDMIALRFRGDASEMVVIDHEDNQLEVILTAESFVTF